MKMKKYLMTGIAALALCAGFTSCSHDLDAPSPEQVKQDEAKKIVNSYNQAFLNYVGGTISPNQDWGFSTTRTRTENANANEWADPTKSYGGLLVPPALTDAQIAVVKKYFQTVPNLGYKDPEWSNYFIQQVYKGHTSVPEGCATPEAYKSADNNDIIASDHMDHLAAIDEENNFFDHINNFNHGDCSTNDNVLNNGGNANDGPFHSDKIMYMKNSTTKSFGYYNSDGSLYHNEYTGLVSWKTIHDWAVVNIDGYDDETGCLKDNWNRSFMGFDFEQMVGEELYARELDYQVEGGYNTEKWGPEGFPEGDYKWFEWKGVKYHQLKSNMNMYAGDLFTCDDTYIQNETNVDNLLADGYLPVDGGANKKWVKVGGTADGYYSDWIVTLTEAKTANDDPNSIRVMAEDLNATGSDDTDFDFNDIVFDVFFDMENTGKTTVLIKAAGGTLNLRIALVQNPSDTNDEDWAEVHDLFSEFNDGLDCAGKMINTNGTKSANANVRNRSLDGLLEPALELPWSITTPAGAKDIKIQVYKNDSWITIDATKGGPAAKFGCKTSYHWMNERVSIKTEVQSFADWCAGKSDLYWPE